MDRFDTCLAFTLREEGPPSNDPGDPGGLTVFGCDQASWPDTLARLPRDVRATMPAHVRDLTLPLATEVYRWAFWNHARCGEMPAGVDLVLFDGSVNPGPNWSPRALQRALGVEADGVLGPVTMAAVQACDPAAVINMISAQRRAYYRSRPGCHLFGDDWLGRADRCRDCALAAVAAS